MKHKVLYTIIFSLSVHTSCKGTDIYSRFPKYTPDDRYHTVPEAAGSGDVNKLEAALKLNLHQEHPYQGDIVVRALQCLTPTLKDYQKLCKESCKSYLWHQDKAKEWDDAAVEASGIYEEPTEMPDWFVNRKIDRLEQVVKILLAAEIDITRCGFLTPYMWAEIEARKINSPRYNSLVDTLKQVEDGIRVQQKKIKEESKAQSDSCA